MTEQRFIYVIDNEEPTFYDLSPQGEIMDLKETEDMLNTLHNENEELKKILNAPLKPHKMNKEELIQLCYHMSLKIGKLQEENKLLKKQL